MESLVVSPHLPTSAEGRTVQPLVGTDLWPFLYIENIHILPTILDLARFSNALSKTLSLYPTFCGRIRHDGCKWWVALTNSVIPVVVQSNPEGTESLPTSPWVVLDQLQPFVEPLHIATLINNDEPLLSVKITLLPKTGETVLGLMVSHMIADGYLTLQFTRCLSQCYQDLEPDSHLTFPPKSLPLVDADPIAVLKIEEANKFIKVGHFSLAEVQQVFMRDWQNTEKIDIRVTSHQLDVLRQIAVKGHVGDAVGLSSPLPISRQDALTAWVVTLINRFLEREPITSIRNNLNYRSIIEPSHIGANAIWFIETSPPLSSSQCHNISAVAHAIRRSVIRASSLATAKEELAVVQQTMTNVANGGRVYCPLPEAGWATVNSNARYDWNSAHFGYPGLTRFHTSWLGQQYIRVFHSNPDVVVQNGQHCIDNPRSGWLDVQFGVNRDIKALVEAAIHKDLNALDSHGQLAMG